MKINSERTTATQCSLSAGHQALHSIETMRVETHHSTPKGGGNNLDNPGEEECDPERGQGGSRPPLQGKTRCKQR